MSKVIVVYGGGFQPFHAGHLSSYLEAKEAFPNADFYVAASNDTKTRPIPFDDKQFLAQQAGVTDPFVQVKMPINPTEILDKYSPKQDIFILVRSERDPVGYTKKDGSPGYYQPFTDISKCKPFGYHGYVFVTHKKEFKLNGQVVYSGTQVRDMYANSDDRGRFNIIKQLYPQSQQQDSIKQMLDKYIGNAEPIVEPDKSAIKQLKAKKLKEQIQRMRPLLKEASIEQKYKMLKLIKEATQLDELDLFKKKTDKLPQKPVSTDDYRAYFNRQAPAKVKTTGKVYQHPDEYYAATKKDPLTVKEFAPGPGGNSGNYFQELASAWYNGTYKSKSLQKGIKSQEDIERLLQRGIICPDGVTRKFSINYNSDFDGVVISSDDYYEHSDYNDQGQEVDGRTGKLWGPYDYMEFSDDELDESLNEFASPGGDDNGPNEEEILFRLAKQWWLGNDQDMIRVERTLASMGWEIGEDEGGYDNGGVFVVRAGDENGKSYMSWPHEDLVDENIDEARVIYAGSKVNLILVYQRKPILLNKEPVAYTDENLKKYAAVAYVYLKQKTGKKYDIESIRRAIVVKPLEVHQTNEESNDYLEEK